VSAFQWSMYRRNGIYYAQIKNEQTGKYLSGRSTGKTNKQDAVIVVAGWLRDGIPEPGEPTRKSTHTVTAIDTVLNAIRTADLTIHDTERILEALKTRGLVHSAVVAGTKGSEPLLDYLIRFWDYDTSPYVADKISHNQSIGRAHCRESANRVRRYWGPEFEGKRLGEVTKSDLRQFGKKLSSSGVSTATVNRAMVAGTVALRWAAENGLIEVNPAAGLMHYSERPKKRGILSPEEAKALFELKWRDERARVANLVAAVTGLRAGEVRALQVRDIGQDRLFIRHSWSDVDGLKSPKNGEERVVPIFPAIRDELLALARTTPHGFDNESFVFPTTLQNKPCELIVFLRGLREALIQLSIGESNDAIKIKRAADAWKARCVVFHSWRHFYAARLADKIDIRRVQLATGHKSAVMAEHYAEHALDADFQAVSEAVGDAFSNIVPFRKAAGHE